MSVSLWNWTEECDGEYCVGDCDKCGKEKPMIIIDYIMALECKNKNAWFVCLKCGKCGRVFDRNGFLIDNGGTTIEEEGEEDELVQ